MKRLDQTISIDDAIKMYNTGISVKAVAAHFKVSPDLLAKYFKARGVVVTRRPKIMPVYNKIDLPSNEVCSMYQGGTSENSIAKHFGVSRIVIRRILTESNIKIRTQSEAEKLKWSKMTNEQRANQVESAHKSSRGVIKTFEHKCNIALAREKLMADHHIGLGETEFREFLIENKIPFFYQKAIDMYNVDFLIGDVVVELTSFTGRYGITRSKQNERIKYLSDRGYKVLTVDLDSVQSLMFFSGYIITCVNRLNRLNSIRSKYWMIRCSDNPSAIRESDRPHNASVSMPKNFAKKWSSVQL